MTDAIAGDEADVALDDVVGLVLVSQTCDIVLSGPGREYVVVCPLVRVPLQRVAELTAGRSLFGSVLEHPPRDDVVVDIGRMTTLHKSAFSGKDRGRGFSTD